MPVFVRGGRYRQTVMNGVRPPPATAFQRAGPDNSVFASITCSERRVTLMLFTGKLRRRYASALRWCSKARQLKWSHRSGTVVMPAP